MRKISLTQSGFSAVVGLVAVVAVIAIAGVGILVFKHDDTKNSNTAVSQTSAESPITDNTQAEQTAAVQLEVKEWGVQIPLSDVIKDAYYVIPTGISKNEDGKPSAIYFGLKSLDDTCGTITSSSTGYDNAIAAFGRYLPNDTDPVSGKKYTEVAPTGTTVNGYYYGYKSRVNYVACAKDSDLQAIDSAFNDAVKGIKPL